MSTSSSTRSTGCCHAASSRSSRISGKTRLAMGDTMLSRPPTQANPVDRIADSETSVGSNLYARFAVRIGVIGFSLDVLLTAVFAVILPDANWDMLPYLAVAEESAYPTPQALHDYAYGTVKAAVSEGDYLA